MTLPAALAEATSYLAPADCRRLEEAYSFAEKAHRGMLRRSGEPFIIHPVAVTTILAEMRLDIQPRRTRK